MNALKKLTPAISLVLFAIAVAVVYHEIKIYQWQEIKNVLFGIPPKVLLQTIWLTLFSYLVLSLYDYLALEYSGEKLPYRRVLLTSFLSYSFSNNIGHGWISGGSMRYRLYSGWGLSALSIGRIVVFCTLTYIIGVLTLIVFSYAIVPDHALINKTLPHHLVQLSVVASVLLLVLWWAIVLFYKKPLSIKQFYLSPPSLWIALRQTFIATLDLLLASAVLYLPLSHYVSLSYSNFLALYIFSMVAGIISMVPGGIGIFEGSFLLLASNHSNSAAHILAPLIIYRSVYYFLPLMIAGVTLAAYEFRFHRLLSSKKVGSLFDIIESAMPKIFSVLLLLGGGVLLLSAVTPGQHERLQALHYLLPLPLIEFSHLISSVMGVFLLFLSRAVGQRLKSAYYATVLVLSVGMIASLAKGWDFEEALILGVMLLVILPAKKYFYRQSALLTLSFPIQWISISAIIIGFSIWLGFFSYKHLAYSHELWWQFSLHGDASRFLRSLMAIFVLSTSLLFYRLLSHASKPPDLPDEQMLQKALPIVRNSTETMHALALIGDKRLLWSESGKSFLMFDTTPKYWIAMGDPAGDPKEFEELAWKFREQADNYGAKVAFYEVSRNYLDVYINLGLTLIKLGEEARVPLPSFSLEGKQRQGLRHAYNKLHREGITFDVVPVDKVPDLLATLQTISDRWMENKRGKEKRFSIGFFDKRYLSLAPVAVVRKDDRILAFSNLWELENKSELSIDLMRYDPDAPPGVMEYLTVNLMLWGKSEGYQCFNLGMAPLSGMEQHPLAPLWQKIGNVIFQYSNEFYNFEGLYKYKNKFYPEWQPRYIALPGSLQLASTLIAVTNLISGGIEGVVKK